MNLIKFLKIRKTVTNPAKINLRNILAVLQAKWRKFRKNKAKAFTLQGITIPQHIWEQTIWRRHVLIYRNSPCWYKGHCVKCGCDTLEKTLEERACHGACYPDMMTPEVWEVYKDLHNIKLFE